MAQLVEHQSPKLVVAGSSPVAPATYTSVLFIPLILFQSKLIIMMLPGRGRFTVSCWWRRRATLSNLEMRVIFVDTITSVIIFGSAKGWWLQVRVPFGFEFMGLVPGGNVYTGRRFVKIDPYQKTSE